MFGAVRSVHPTFWGWMSGGDGAQCAPYGAGKAGSAVGPAGRSVGRWLHAERWQQKEVALEIGGEGWLKTVAAPDVIRGLGLLP